MLAPQPNDRAAWRAALARRILVVGDVMVDRYLNGRVRPDGAEGSPTPPILDVSAGPPEVVDGLGGAGNAAAAAAALGASVVLVGVVGDDDEGAALLALAARWGMDVSGVVVDPGRCTTLKTRIQSRGHPLLRVDREDHHPLSPAVAGEVAAAVSRGMVGADAVVLSDYDKGLFRGVDPAAWIRAAGEVPVLVDPKPANLSRFRGARLITPNEAEAIAAVSAQLAGATVPQAARRLREALGCEAAVVTRGARGLWADRRAGPPVEMPALCPSAVDATGAGDTFIAALAVALAAGQGLVAALSFASRAAAVVVGRPGTAVATLDDLLEGLTAPPPQPGASPCGA